MSLRRGYHLAAREYTGGRERPYGHRFIIINANPVCKTVAGTPKSLPNSRPATQLLSARRRISEFLDALCPPLGQLAYLLGMLGREIVRFGTIFAEVV